MHQPRILTRTEALLRDAASGASNLLAAPGQWYECAPTHNDERFEVAAIGLILAGPGLLANLDSFSGAAGVLEFAIVLFDGYSALRDLAAVAPYQISTGFEWQAGSFSGTHAATDAGAPADGSARLGLKGLPQIFGFAAPLTASWESAPISLRYGAAVSALSWDAWLLRDASGGTLAPPQIELRTGVNGATIVWQPYATVASTIAELEAGGVTLAAPSAGDVMQIRVTLPYQDPGIATLERETVVRTATLFSLCAWITLDASRWRFGGLGELIDRSEIGRHLAPSGWSTGDDVAILRLPLTAMLRGAHGESLRARFVAGAAGVALSFAEAFAVADLRFDPAKA